MHVEGMVSHTKICKENKMKSKTRFFTFLLAAAMVLFVTAFSIPTLAATPDTIITSDREGNPITLPPTIHRVISMGPSNTEILVALGFGDTIIATDDYSSNVEGLNSDVLMFSMMTPDGERIISLEPDVIFATGMSKAGGDDPFKIISNAGICMIYIPSSSSIDGIKEDIRFIAAVMGAQLEGERVIAEMEQEIDSIRTIGQTITDKKSVYFELASDPHLYSFGSGVFLDEMLDIIGAKNIFADQDGWISVADEAILDANPDVILTSVNYLDDPIGEIVSRPGWREITAVQNDDVYYIDTDSSNRPSHNVIKALKEMAKAIYPDSF
jgi:iron complex transport system substrate-binding protein